MTLGLGKRVRAGERWREEKQWTAVSVAKVKTAQVLRGQRKALEIAEGGCMVPS